MFPLESTFRRFPYFLSTTTPLRNRRKESALGSPFAEAGGVLAGPGLTVWGSWGRRCSAAAHEGTRRTPACLGSSGSPDSRIRETCTLQKNTDVVRSAPSAALHFWACLRTRHGVVHVEAVAFDVFQIHASVHKHAERKEELWKVAPRCAAEVEPEMLSLNSPPLDVFAAPPVQFGSVQNFVQQLK